MTSYDRFGIAAFKPAAMAWFMFKRAVHHDLFVRQRRLPGSNVLLLPFGYGFRAAGMVARWWRNASTWAALKVYSGTLQRHYGPEGLAYGHLGSKSRDERAAIFNKQQGRIRFYMNDRRVLDFANGDSFLDCGCGAGQNVVELRRAFPSSPIKAFDYNAAGVAVVAAGTEGDKLTTVEQGSVLDAAYLASYPAASFDHVLISHVMGFMLRSTAEETRAARQKIIDELVRIARRTVLVLDAVEVRQELSVTIEQRDRGVVHDDLTRYFPVRADGGQVYIMLSPEDQAIIYRKSKSIS